MFAELLPSELSVIVNKEPKNAVLDQKCTFNKRAKVEMYSNLHVNLKCFIFCCV